MKNQKNRLIELLMAMILSLFLISPIVQSFENDENAAIEITSITKEKGGLIITISNTGETYIRGIQINISVSGGWIKPIDFQYNDLLFICNCTDVFEPGDTHTIYTSENETFFSIGFLNISVIVSSHATGVISNTKNAFIIGSFIILF